MLGLANTVSSSSTPESKYSLTFDGSDDHVNLGDVLDLGTDNFTISLWAKFADATHGGVVAYFLAKNQDSNNRVRLFLATNGKIQVRIDGDGSSVINKTGDTAVTALEDTWVHICVSCARDGNLLLYVNGSTSTYGFSHDVSSSSSVDLDNTGPWIIGAISADSNFFDGKIADFAIWNVALDSDAVAAIYNSGKPTNLTFDNGNYDNSSALVAYYKMGNGSFDDKANGVIHDQHAPGFSAEKLTNGDFSTAGTITTSSWSLGWAQAGGDGGGANITGGELVLALPDGEDSNYNRVYATNGSSAITGVVEVGKSYKLTYTVTAVTGSPTFKYIDGGAYATAAASLGSHVIYYVCTTTANFGFRNSGNDSSITLDNVSLVELNGLPGLTSGGPIFTSDTP